MKIKSFTEFLNEGGMFFVPGRIGAVSTNMGNMQTSLKQAYPDAEDSKEQDPYNPSVINKNAEMEPGGDVAFISKDQKTKGGSIDTFGNRTKEQGTNGQSIYGQSGVSEGGLGDNQVAGQPVFRQTVDRSKQGYQDAMYYGDDEVDSHGAECDCPDCLAKYESTNEKELKNLNDLEWGLPRKHKDLEIPLDELPLIDPPSNDSNITKQELHYLSKLPKTTKFDKDNDADFSHTFSDFLKYTNDGPEAKNVSKKEINNYSKRVRDIVIALKNHYNRPRPHQLAQYHDISLDVYPSVSGNSPSYPSGHSVQPFAIATALSKEYPDLKTELFNIADQIAQGRMRMRIHFPSDYEYGKMLGILIGKRLSI